MNAEPLSGHAPHRPPADRRLLRVSATIFVVVCSVAALLVFAATSLGTDVLPGHIVEASALPH